MAGNKHRKKIVTLLIAVTTTILCMTTVKPITSPAGEEITKRSHEERRQFHLITVVQRKLIELGYDPGPVNGFNGPETQRAIKEYQRDNGLTVDGIPGPKTLESLGY